MGPADKNTAPSLRSGLRLRARTPAKRLNFACLTSLALGSAGAQDDIPDRIRRDEKHKICFAQACGMLRLYTTIMISRLAGVSAGAA